MTALTTVYLVRHGETDWNASDRCQGSVDVPMNAAGVAQIASLLEVLRPIRFDAAFTSPLGRARQTAEILLGDSGVQPIELEELAELCYGTCQGQTSAEWQGDTGAHWLADPWSLTFPEGESLVQLRGRVSSAIEEILDTHEGSCILVSGHGHANRVLIIDALGLEPGTFWDIPQPNGSAYRLQYRRSGSGEWVAASASPVAGTFSGNNVIGQSGT